MGGVRGELRNRGPAGIRGARCVDTCLAVALQPRVQVVHRRLEALDDLRGLRLALSISLGLDTLHVSQAVRHQGIDEFAGQAEL